MEFFLSALRALNEVLTAGVAIIAFSLLLYALSFNLKDRVARSFAVISISVAVVFSSEAIASAVVTLEAREIWQQLEWIGLVFLPAGYFHFSDALLATTGRPSRGRRRLVVRLVYLLSTVFLATLPSGRLVGGLAQDGIGLYYLERTALTWVFAVYYVAILSWSWVNFWRAYQRTVTPTSRRRMQYLLTGAVAPALGSFPYLPFAGQIAVAQPLVFWVVAFLSNLAVGFLLILMSYAVAFFGVPWPDRVVKRRLSKWFLRGPATAILVLVLTTFISRAGNFLGIAENVFVPIVMVVSILVMEHGISLMAPVWERLLFSSGDQENLKLLQNLEERLLTQGDLRQYLEAVLAAICDQFQVSTAFIASIGPSGLGLFLPLGDAKTWSDEELSKNILAAVQHDERPDEEAVFSWGNYWLRPLYNARAPEELMGVLGVQGNTSEPLNDDRREALLIFGSRAALALEDQLQQQEVFASLKSLTPQVELVQRLRAASSYDTEGVLINLEELPESIDLSQYVKDALTHYWGGPKLSQSPLIRLKVVQRVLEEEEENSVNALRSILKQAIDQVKPQGERRFTGEWILYNILELKFLQGRKVREVALRLAMSEADLYRKQRVALEAVAQAIVAMELQAQDEDRNGRVKQESRRITTPERYEP